MYYTVIKHDRHLRTREKCRKHELQASVFYISRVFSIIPPARVGYEMIANQARPKILDKSSRLYFVRRNRMGNIRVFFKCVNLHCYALTNTSA